MGAHEWSPVVPKGRRSDGDEPRTAVNRSRPKQPSKNSTRERRTQELTDLRASHEQLAELLVSLQQRRKRQLRVHYDGGRVASTAPVWEAIARRQFQARRKAEVKNSNLRRSLDQQAHVARSLLSFARRVASKTDLQYQTMVGGLDPMYVCRRVNDDELLERVTHLRTQASAVFALNEKFEAATIDFYDSRAVPTFDRSVLLEASGSVTLPFSVDTVEAAVWALYNEKLTKAPGEITFEPQNMTLDSVNGMFTYLVEYQAFRGVLSGRLLAKRYSPTPTSRLVVAHACCKPEPFITDLGGIIIGEDSWLRLVDVRELCHSPPKSPLTILQYVQRTRLRPSLQSEELSPFVHDSVAYFKAQVEAELAWALQIIDAKLMSSAARTS